jgi:myo-inositol 2-dehydrogenase/D-chiro-inositol 1-dehydrogenase
MKIGIIGAGVMGADHAHILSTSVAGVEIAAIADADAGRARRVAGENGIGRILADGFDVVKDDGIDAVLIASPDETHKPLVLACLDAGKPVLCEKPLARAAADCLEIVRRECGIGRRLVQVGFMRRFDPGYVDMRRTVESGELGAPLIMHCIHRNESAPAYVEAQGLIANSAVHEFDAARYVLGGEPARISVVIGRATSKARIPDPQLVLLEFRDGTVVDIEVFLNARYGYDVRAELVCEEGTISLAPPHATTMVHRQHDGFQHPRDWRPRFADAYRAELRAWAAFLSGGPAAGASAWDGYVATSIAEAGIRAQKSGQWETIELAERPALYGAGA